MANCIDEFVHRWMFLAKERGQYCVDCERRKGMKNGKMRFVYDIGDAPCRSCGIEDVLSDFEDYPADDVQTVRHGRWIKDCKVAFFWDCSECGCYVFWEPQSYLLRPEDKMNYCPNCGCRMDSEDDNG